MKTLSEIQRLSAEFEKRFGFNISDAPQGTMPWFQAKLGVISASNASKVVAKVDSETRATYMAELIAQVCTGLHEEIRGAALDWGNQHEDAARSCYEFAANVEIQQVPFVFKDSSFREGCSPDGLVGKKGVEIKCPFNSVHYIKFLTGDAIKPEYQWQCQYTLRVMGADEWDFVQYDPRMKVSPLKILTVERDLKKQAQFDEMIPKFLEDMDKVLAQISVTFGDQWKRLAEVSGKAVVE